MELLTVTEAALKLGITKELLFAYVRNAPKQHLGEDRKLVTVVKGGQNYFAEDELLSFDEYLKKPWSNPGETRPSIPSYIQDYLKVEIGGKCPISGKGYPLDNAHVVPYNESLNHHHHNIVRVSKEEHTKIDNGVIPRTLLKETKSKLIESLRTTLRLENDGYRSSLKPPIPNALFVGRFGKLLELTSAMEFERLVVVQGLGGIGKTQLLLQALDNVQYHNPVLWIDVEVMGSFDNLLVILNNVTSTHGTQAESLVDSLREIPITIVFDSLEKLLISERDAVEDFLNALLTKTSNSQIIITTQIDLTVFDQQKKVITLDGLDRDESNILLEELLGEEMTPPPDHIGWLLDFCNGHPLCIRLIASLIKFYKSSNRAIDVLRTTGNPINPLRIKHNKSTALDVCLSTIYNCLSTEQEKIIQYIKFFPGGLKLLWAEEEFKDLDFATDISVLQQFFFIQISRDQLDLERISIPNPIRPFLREKAKTKSIDEELKVQKDAIVCIMMEAAIVDLHYIESGIHGPQSYGIVRIEDEMPNLLEAFHIATERSDYHEREGHPELAEEYVSVIAGIAGALGKFCFTRGYFDYGIMFSKAGVRANIRLNEIDTASTQYMYLAQIQWSQYDETSFSNTVVELEELAKSTGNLTATIYSAWAKGRLELYRNNFANALILYEQAASLISKKIEANKVSGSIQRIDDDTLRKQAETSDIGNWALVTGEIGKVHEFSGNYSEATKYHKKAIDVQERFNDETNLMSSYHHYANCLMHLGQSDLGLEYYFKSIEGFNRNKQFEYLSNSISDLGRYIEERPELANHDLLDEETLMLALNSISDNVKDFIERESTRKSLDDVIDAIPFELLGKSILMINVLGFSQYSHKLCDWISDLTVGIDIQRIKPGLFGAILNVGHAVGGVSEWRSLPENKPLMIKSILQGCLLINGGPDLKSKSRIFPWLAKWMRHVGLDKDATAEKLWEEAWGSFDR
ncbi:MAG TPA: hypothetical protein PKL56_18280 [Cyclobacteriaceae bacterium]|nr:hypothetical protein [Cyclobacteriaceae bacterium]HMX00938.1 hypothetical protein [Cyclobacteriaceae bacterium]HMX50019.1 hypothetical protein [Cyclobacteriaceae bacterium]HMY93742.1 hypothetical protein [Cyclobacteriaceae bacterium]HNA12603.1 hypothetical protein [Cyclobacteriaceae bacterium]